MVAAAAAKGFGAAQEDSATVPEVPAAEDPAATTTKTTQADATQTQTEGEPEHSYSLEQDGFVSARDLAAKIDANEALKTALPADIRNEIMANARLAQEGSEFKQIFASPDEAKVIADSAKEFAGFQEAFVSVTPDNVVQGTTNLISLMLQSSYRRDEDGNLLMRDGKPVTDGTVGRFLTEAAKRWVDHNIVKKLEGLNDDSVTAALDLVMERAGLRPSTAEQGQEVDQAIAARKAELDRQEAEIKAQKEAARTEQIKSYKSALNTQLGQVWEEETGKLLSAATGLSEFDREAVTQQINSAMVKALRESTAYRREKDQLEMRPMGDKRRAAEVALARSFLRTNLARIASPILAKAGVSVKAKADARQESQAAREQASRGEVRSGAAAKSTRAGTSQNPAQERAAVATDLKGRLGRDPNDSEINIEMMERAYKRRTNAA